MRLSDEPGLPFRHASPQQQASEHRHQRERKNKRASERKDYRQRHRAEHLSLDTLKRENRQINDDDYTDREKDRAEDLASGFEDDAFHLVVAQLRPVVRVAAAFREMTHDVLDHHDRAVHDEAKIYRAETHQVP